MGEILGLGCSHASMIWRPAEDWAGLRKNIYSRHGNSQALAAMAEELGDDDGLSHDKINAQRIVDAFDVLRQKLHEWKPDVVLIVGDDQQENFKRENLPTFCLYTGSEVTGYPFHGSRSQANIWNAPSDTEYTYRCPAGFSQDMLAYLIRDGFDLSSTTNLNGWEWGLPHAHINPLPFLDPEQKLTILPLFVNCIGEEAGEGYPPRPTAKRCYELGQAIRRFLDARTERVAVIGSSSWSHSFLTHKFDCAEFDTQFDRRNLELLRKGQGAKLAELTPEEIQQSGDHEFLNWLVPLGVMGDRPAHIVDVLDEQSQISFKVFAIWDE